MEKDKIYAYRSVFKRDEVKEFHFLSLISNPNFIFESFEIKDYESICANIKKETDKSIRNEMKRTLLPAVDISPSSILSIDIDGIHDSEMVKAKVIAKLKTNPATYAIKESISGNVVAFFKYECTVEEFPYLYYKLYLELVLLTGVNIDFLPEIGRLRYVSMGETYYLNEDSETVYEMLVVDSLPHIKTVVKKQDARTVIYKSC